VSRSGAEFNPFILSGLSNPADPALSPSEAALSRGSNGGVTGGGREQRRRLPLFEYGVVNAS
jgi:hypothetical protein